MKYCVDPKLLKYCESIDTEESITSKMLKARVKFVDDYVKSVIGEKAYNWALEHPDQIQALGDVKGLVKEANEAFMNMVETMVKKAGKNEH